MRRCEVTRMNNIPGRGWGKRLRVSGAGGKGLRVSGASCRGGGAKTGWPRAAGNIIFVSSCVN